MPAGRAVRARTPPTIGARERRRPAVPRPARATAPSRPGPARRRTRRARPRRPGRRRRAGSGRRAPTGWPRPAGTWPWWRRRSSPARRPAATGSPRARCASSPTWGSRAPLAGAHRYTGPPGPRLRSGARPPVARAPELPQLRLHHHPPRPRRHRERAGRQGRGHRLAGHRGPRADPRRIRPGAGRRRAPRCPPASGAVVHGEGDRNHPRRPGPLRGGGRRGQLPVRPGPRHRPEPRPPAGHGPAGLLHAPRATTSRSSSPTSTSATATAAWSPATAGSSRWATGG